VKGISMPNLRTPLYDLHVAHKAKIVEFGGWDMPVQFTGIIDEHTAVRTSAGLFDISHMGRLSFAGPDALDLIQYGYTNNAATMKDFQVRYGLVCNELGGIRDDVLVYRWPYGWAMVVNASNRAKIVEWLEKQKGSRQVQMADQTMQSCMVAVQGPKALEICRGLTEAEAGQLKYYYAAPTRYKGKQCVISRTGYTGEDGIEVMIGEDMAVELWDDLVARGAKPCGLGARDTLRLEAAMPLYGHELTEETNPIEAGLAWAVKLDKGDFIGRGPIETAVAGHERQRVGLELDGKRAAREGSTVESDGRPVGRVTSGSFAPTLQKSIAMAYVERASAAVGTRLQVEIRGDRVAAQVVKLPFYQRTKS
jgi:aminomethyltransferase